jgi:hypothetical protein
MDFLMSTSFDLPTAMQSSTRIEEDCGEWGKKFNELATRNIKNKIIYLKSVNCHWRLEGIDWYCDDYYYKRIKYVLYYESYEFVRFCTDYKIVLVDITTSWFSKRMISLPRVPGGKILNYFEHSFFDLPIRSKKLQAALYVAVQIETTPPSQYCVRYIADQSGVLVSPLLIQRFRKDVAGIC